MAFWRQRQQMLQAGARAPDFEAKDLNGGSHSLHALLGGGPVLLAFFKASCPVCQFTFPILERIHKSGSGIRMFGVSQDKAGTTREFNAEYGITFATLLDDTSGYPISNAFGLHTVPSLFVIEPDGIISTAVHGFSRKDVETVAARAGAQAFSAGERVPEFRPG